jgi:hypothetical protein
VTTALLILAVLGFTLVCSLHGLWRMRRGRSACGCLPAADAAALRARQLDLGERVRELRAGGERASPD